MQEELGGLFPVELRMAFITTSTYTDYRRGVQPFYVVQKERESEPSRHRIGVRCRCHLIAGVEVKVLAFVGASTRYARQGCR